MKFRYGSGSCPSKRNTMNDEIRLGGDSLKSNKCQIGLTFKRIFRKCRQFIWQRKKYILIFIIIYKGTYTKVQNTILANYQRMPVIINNFTTIL